MDFGRCLQGARSDVSCLVSPPPSNLQSFVPLPACVVSLMQLRGRDCKFLNEAHSIKIFMSFSKILTNSIYTLKIHNLTLFASWMLISKYAELIWQHCSCVKASWLKIALMLHLQITTICSSPPPPAWQCQADRVIPMMSGDALLSTHLCWVRNRVPEERGSRRRGWELHWERMRAVICAGKVPVRKQRLALDGEQRAVGKVMFTYHRQGLTWKRMARAEVLGFWCLFPC